MSNSYPPVLREALRVYAGDDRSFLIERLDESNNPVDLTGSVFTAAWRKSRASDDYVEFAVNETDLDAGKITLVVSAEATAAIASSSRGGSVYGVWDIQRTVGSVTETYLTGTMYCTKDVTP